MKNQKSIERKEKQCHAIYEKVKEAWTPDKRSFEQAEQDALTKKAVKYCNCKANYDVRILNIEPPLAICTHCGKYIENNEQTPEFDKAYLDDCIKKATPNLSKIKDVDKELSEIRGVKPESEMAEEILEFLSNKMYEDKIAHDYKDGKIDYLNIDEWFLSQKQAIAKFAFQKQLPLREEMIRYERFHGNNEDKIEGWYEKEFVEWMIFSNECNLKAQIESDIQESEEEMINRLYIYWKNLTENEEK